MRVLPCATVPFAYTIRGDFAPGARDCTISSVLFLDQKLNPERLLDIVVSSECILWSGTCDCGPPGDDSEILIHQDRAEPADGGSNNRAQRSPVGRSLDCADDASADRPHAGRHDRPASRAYDATNDCASRTPYERANRGCSSRTTRRRIWRIWRRDCRRLSAPNVGVVSSSDRISGPLAAASMVLRDARLIGIVAVLAALEQREEIGFIWRLVRLRAEVSRQ
jgi:hypothetical protein